MDSINPWLDVKELDRLANALIQPVAGQKSTGGADVARSSASKALAKASKLAKSSGVIAKASTRQAALPELGEWLYSNARCEGLCVVDRDGDVLHKAMPNPEWTKLTVLAATTGQGIDPSNSPNIRLKVRANGYLQFIAVETARGALLVGLLTRNLLKDSQLIEFSDLVEKISAADQVAKR